MFAKNPFPLRHIAFLIGLAYAPFSAATQAGRIDFTTGEPVLKSRGGREQALVKGMEISTGDRISTNAGRAQISFTDGSFISLQPNTVFGIDEYHFKGKNDGTEKGSFSLVKGALRTITGLIGRGERDAYSMRTPTATIGIRGTGGQIEVTPEGTLIRGTSGVWLMSTAGGTIAVPAGTTGFAPNQEKPPFPVQTSPNTPPASQEGSNLPPVFIAGNQVGTVVTPRMSDGPGYKVGSVRWDGDFMEQITHSSTYATFNSGKLTSWDGGQTALGEGTVVDSGNDGLIGWGRWTGTLNMYPPITYNSDKGVHYVVGLPTAVMPSAGTVTYSLLGGTSPTWINANGSGSLNSGSLTVNLNGGASTVNVALNLTIGSSTYDLSNATPYAAGNGAFSGAISATSTSTSCSMGCSGNINGFFTGTNADRAGLTYKISADNDTFMGAAAFKKP